MNKEVFKTMNTTFWVSTTFVLSNHFGSPPVWFDMILIPVVWGVVEHFFGGSNDNS